MSRFVNTFALLALVAQLSNASPIPVAAPQFDAPWQTASWQSAPWQTASWQSAPWQTAPGQLAPGAAVVATATDAPVAPAEATSTPAPAAATPSVVSVVADDNLVVTQVVTEVEVATVTDSVFTTVVEGAVVNPTPGLPAPVSPVHAPSNHPVFTSEISAPTSPPAPQHTSSTSVYVAPPPPSSTPAAEPTTTTSVYVPPPAPTTSSTTEAAPSPTIEPSTSSPPPTVASSSPAPVAEPSSQPSSSSGSTGTTYNGIATINPNPTNALGSCGGSTGDATFTVALGTAWIKSFNSPLCNKQIRLTNTGPSTDMSIGGKGNSVTVTVMDTCMGCDATHLDLSTAAWNQLTNSAADSQVSISWEFI